MIQISLVKGLKRAFLKSLLKELYKETPEKVLEIDDFLEIEQAEVEDLIPYELMEKYITRLSKGIDEDFEDY